MANKRKSERNKYERIFGSSKKTRQEIKRAGASIEARGVTPKKEDGKYYLVVSGTSLKKEINAKQYAGHIRSFHALRDSGEFMSKAKESRIARAASNMGEKNLQKFYNEHKERINSYPTKYEDTMHIGSALKSVISYNGYRFRINGKFAKMSKAINYLNDVNANIDKGQKSGSTPSIFVTFKIDEDKKTISIKYHSDEDENEE